MDMTEAEIADIENEPTIELKKPTIADGVPPEVLKAAEELGEYIGKFIEAVMEAAQGGEIWRDR